MTTSPPSWSERRAAIDAAFDAAKLARDRALGRLALEIMEESQPRKAAAALFGRRHTGLIEYARYARFVQLYPGMALSEREFRMRWVRHSDRTLIRRGGLTYEAEVFLLVSQDQTPPPLTVQQVHGTAMRKHRDHVTTEEDGLDELRRVFTDDHYAEALDTLVGLLDREGTIFAPQSIGVYAHKMKEMRAIMRKVLSGGRKRKQTGSH
jgi:hypothetical protein